LVDLKGHGRKVREKDERDRREGVAV